VTGLLTSIAFLPLRIAPQIMAQGSGIYRNTGGSGVSLGAVLQYKAQNEQGS
jgi:hypothetical protein